MKQLTTKKTMVKKNLGAEILRSTDKFKIILGLDRVKKMLDIFSHPEHNMQFVHVAGTNGKGSVCSMIEAILIEDGRKNIGKYTSPHLFDYTERISVNGKDISEEEFNELVELVNEKDKEYEVGLSEFEILTVVCFLYFERKNVEIAILETGLGGRLDATNVIDNPLISVITSISYDHKEKLGDSIEKIAYEKAGIIKEGAKCLFSKNNSGYKTLLENAKQKKALIIDEDENIKVENKTVYINGAPSPFGLSGDFQEENLKLAYSAIKALPFEVDLETIKKALAKVRWKFRMDEFMFLGSKVLADGCHNPDGARVLSDYLNKYYQNSKIKFIFGCLKHKDYEQIIKTLYNPSYDFCFYEFNYPNALKYGELGDLKERFRKTDDPILEIKKNDCDLCVVSGSLYMLGEIFKTK